MKRYTIEEFVSKWVPRVVVFSLRDADKRIRALQASEPHKRFRII